MEKFYGYIMGKSPDDMEISPIFHFRSQALAWLLDRVTDHLVGHLIYPEDDDGTAFREALQIMEDKVCPYDGTRFGIETTDVEAGPASTFVVQSAVDPADWPRVNSWPAAVRLAYVLMLLHIVYDHNGRYENSGLDPRSSYECGCGFWVRIEVE